MPTMALSFTRAKCFDECPLKFKAKYVDKVQEMPTLPLLVGEFLHEVADRYNKHLVAEKIQSDFSAMDRILAEEWPKRPAQLPAFMYPEVADLASRMKEGMTVKKPEDVIGSEVEFALTWDMTKTAWLGRDAFLRGKMDRLDVDLDGMATVWDLKTGYAMEEAEDSQQGKIYSLAVRKLVDQVRDVRVQFYYPRFQIVKQAVLTEDDAYQAEKWLKDISASIERCKVGLFPATPGLGCRYCPIRETECPVARQVSNVAPPDNVGAAEELLARLIVISAQYDDVKGKLEPWVRANGAVSVNGMAAEIGVVHKYAYNTRELEVVLRNHRLNPLEYFKGDTQALKKAMKRDKALESRIVALREDKSTNRFNLRKAGDKQEDDD